MKTEKEILEEENRFLKDLLGSHFTKIDKIEKKIEQNKKRIKALK